MQKNSIDEKVVDMMFSVFKGLKEESSFDNDAFHLTFQQVYTLVFIAKHKSVTASELASYFGITLPSTTVLVNKLSALSLIRKAPDEKDKRVVHLTLTKNAEKILQKAKRIKSQNAHKFLSYLSE